MEAVLLVIHLLACLALIGAVLLQRSEGGALGMSGGGTGGFISGRGVANVLVRTTMILGAGFFITSLVLARIHSEEEARGSELERTIEQRNDDVFDPLSSPPATTPPSGAAPAPGQTPAAAPSAPVVDPLAPVLTQPQAGAVTPPSTPAPSTPAPSTPAPATSTAPASSPAPVTPAPTPAPQ